MDERNKDLPLIVSEILIEMHEMKGDIREMKDALNRVATVVLKQQEHTNSMFNVLLDENKKNMEFLTGMVAEARQETVSENKKNMEFLTGMVAEARQETVSENKKNMEFLTGMVAEARQETVSLTQQARQENISLINEVRREGEEGRQFLTYSINKALGQQQQANAVFEQRLTELEAKYNG